MVGGQLVLKISTGHSHAEDRETTVQNRPTTASEISFALGGTTGFRLVIVLIAILFILFFGTLLVTNFLHANERIYDFAQEWTSIQNFYRGRPIYLELSATYPELLGAAAPDNILYNAHPPAAVLLALPFCNTGYHHAYIAWSVFSLALMVGSVVAVARQPNVEYRTWLLFPIFAIILSSNALIHQTIQGQLNLILLALIVASWAWERGGRSSLAGVCIGIAAAIKIFPAFLMLYFVVRRRWRAVAAAAAAFAAVNFTAALVFGPEAFTDYVTKVMPELSKFRDTWPNASLLGFWSKLFDASGPFSYMDPLISAPWLVEPLYLISAAIVVALTALGVRAASSRQERDTAFALCVVAMLIVSPLTWDHYFVLLFLPLLVLWKVDNGGTLGRVFLMIAGAGLVIFNPYRFWDAAVAEQAIVVDGARATIRWASPLHTLTILSHQFYLLVALFIFAWCMVRPMASRRPKRPADLAVA